MKNYGLTLNNVWDDTKESKNTEKRMAMLGLKEIVNNLAKESVVS